MGEKKKARASKEGSLAAAAATAAAAAAATDDSSSASPGKGANKQQEQQQQQQGQQQQQEAEAASFESLGLCREICAAAAAAKWQRPTEVQQKVIPLVLQQLQRLRGVHTLQHRDLIAVAKTGSGKTGAFLLPLLQQLVQHGSSSSRISSSSSSSSSPFAVILSPTRELALQVFDWVQALTAAAAAAESTAAAAAAAAAALRGCCCALVGDMLYWMKRINFSAPNTLTS
ncbi:hypothetical protein, conserved [Eimeria acervulina]|uniref:ATP-dependent RNA helicase n=1 Tax=Eimeria acervulina TaxID=5801 RepID=U6GHD6_EIMAC|nr:hypothetical protein, conserved [Eimeria acervulina]CDI79661.1 hypothetical protein, conserved [Eimeria acervulina]